MLDTAIIPISQIRKLRLEQIQQLTQCHMDGNNQNLSQI